MPCLGKHKHKKPFHTKRQPVHHKEADQVAGKTEERRKESVQLQGTPGPYMGTVVVLHVGKVVTWTGPCNSRTLQTVWQTSPIYGPGNLSYA